MSVKNGALKLAVRSVGRLSDGIDLSLRYGFVSGKMLDYVYRNEPSGRTFVGRWLDAVYLRHRGWEAIRVRKRHLEELLAVAIDACLERDGRARVLDVASGPARYVLDTLDRYRDQDVRATCRDIDERWLAEGQIRANEMGLTSVSFERGDAFDESHAASPSPNVVVASGFYDWLPEDDLVRRSMRIAHASSSPSAFLLFTIQSGHSDLAMVNHVFTGIEGHALEMKTRPEALVRAWATEVGYRVEGGASDPWGYYPVTLARKAG